MADLLPPPLARDERFGALGQLAGRISDIDLTPVLVYLIDAVDESVLGHLAEQFHIHGDEGWLLAQTGQSRRELIKRSIELHRHKGTPWAVKQLLDAVGARAELREWWEMDPPGEPHTFEIDVFASSLTPEPDGPFLGDVASKRFADLINTVKPERSHYTLRIGASGQVQIATGGALLRPVLHIAPSASQPLERQCTGLETLAVGGAIQRPCVHVAPAGWQDHDRDLRATIGQTLIAAMTRPVIYITAICNQPGVAA